MKVKKLIPLIAAALTLSACAQIPPVKETVPPEQQKTVSPPENGWTAEELMSVSYIYDQSLEYPLTLESFGGGVSFIPISVYSDNKEEREQLWYSIYPYNANTDPDYVSYSAVSYGRTEDNATAYEPVAELQCYSDFASFNGLKHALPEEDIEKLLGKPDRIDETDDNSIVYVYCDRERGSELITVRVSKVNKLVISVDITF